MSWAAVGGAAVGAAGSLFGASKAKKAQKKAAKDALNLQQYMYEQTRTDNMPALQARNNALGQMDILAQRYGNGMPTAEQVMATPGYQFGLDQGRDALEGAASARGGFYSGKMGKDLLKFGTDYGTTKYGDAFNQMQSAQTNDYNRWASMAGLGQTGANTVATSGQNYANMGGNIGMGAANAYGAASIAQGNVLGNFATQLGAAGADWFKSQKPSTGISINPVLDGEYGYADGGPVINGPYDPNMPTSGGAYAPYSPQRPDFMPRQRMGFQPVRPVMARYGRMAFADGGRVEPVPGTKAPVKQGGTGGGLNSLKTAIDEARLKQAAKVRPNPLNPRAVLQDQEARAGLAMGGAVCGPGGPRDDMVPAMLSNGEHVFDVPAVNAIGDGSNEKGQQRLNQLRQMLKAA